MTIDVKDRCPTGIIGLDEILGGGFIRGTITLLIGAPGTGKTTFAAKFIYEGAKRWKEPGIYVSFTESKSKFMNFMKSLGLDFKELEKKKLFKFIQYPTPISKQAIASILNDMLTAIDNFKAKRVVIDPITPLSLLLDHNELRSLLHNTLSKITEALEATVILISDESLYRGLLGYGVEEFIVDTIIKLKLLETDSVPSAPNRVMDIIKMRGQRVSPTRYYFSIVPKEGILVFTNFLLSRITREPSWEKLKTGIDLLDKILDGGLVKGSSTLIYGPSGSGKSLLVLTILANITLEGKSTIYITFKRTKAEIKRTLRYLGYDPDVLEQKGLTIESMDPREVIAAEMLYQYMEYYDRGLGRDLKVVDNLDEFIEEHGFNITRRLLKNMIYFDESKGITSVFCLTTPSRSKLATRLEPLFNNVIVSDIEVTKDEKLIRTLRFKKIPFKAASTTKYVLSLEENKVKIYEFER